MDVEFLVEVRMCRNKGRRSGIQLTPMARVNKCCEGEGELVAQELHSC